MLSYYVIYMYVTTYLNCLIIFISFHTKETPYIQDFFVDPPCPSWQQAAEAPTSSSGTLPVPPASARLSLPVTQLQLVFLPSGYVKIAIENGHL